MTASTVHATAGMVRVTNPVTPGSECNPTPWLGTGHRKHVVRACACVSSRREEGTRGRGGASASLTPGGEVRSKKSPPTDGAECTGRRDFGGTDARLHTYIGLGLARTATSANGACVFYQPVSPLFAAARTKRKNPNDTTYDLTGGVERRRFVFVVLFFYFFSAKTLLSSPEVCICFMMSHPPTNSPSIKICGMVGHEVKSLMPARSSCQTGCTPQPQHNPIYLPSQTKRIHNPSTTYYTMVLSFPYSVRGEGEGEGEEGRG
jgi:hypothetical protein